MFGNATIGRKDRDSNRLLRATLYRVIVKSDVLPIDSSGDLIDVGHFDSIVEFHSINHLSQIIESA